MQRGRESERRELEVHPEEFVEFREKRWKKEGGEDKNRPDEGR